MVIRSLRRYEAAQKNKRGKISERHSMGGHARGGSVDVYNPDEIDAIAAQIRGAI